MANSTCVVSIRNRLGDAYSVTAAGKSLFAVCASALEFFEDDYWKGPKPRPDTILEVDVVGSQATYRVRASRVKQWLSSAREWAWIFSLFRAAGIDPTQPVK